MEKAILKTLAYADIFDYPLKLYEIHKWLIGRKATLRQVEKALGRLDQKSKIKNQNGYYFLSGRNGLIAKRQRRQKQSVNYLKKAKVLTAILKIIPWIKLVGISGGLAMDNAERGDDIDLFVVTSKNRLWASRLLTLALLSLTGQRRKKEDSGRKIAGKLCLNILLEEDRLAQNSKDIYLAHEVLQMKVLWQKDGVYGKYLEDNQWAFKFLPNWTTVARGPASSASFPLTVGPASLLETLRLRVGSPSSLSPLATLLEKLAKWLQLKVMKKPKGLERIEDGALYFHPKDCRPQISALYRQKVKSFSTT